MGEGGWIKLRKTLKGDPRLLRMASELGQLDQAQGRTPLTFERLLVSCVGAVCILWITADTYVQENDVLPLGPDHIDRITGIEGFCKLMPSDWLQIVDANHVKLPNFQAHNGSSAKKRALENARKTRYRHNVAYLKRGQ